MFKRRITATILLFFLVFFAFHLIGQEKESEKEVKVENVEKTKPLKNVRERHEYFSIAISGGFLGLGAHVTIGTLRYGHFYWDIFSVEGFFLLGLGGAGYTKLGFVENFNKNLELRVGVGLGGGAGSGFLYFYGGFYLNPEINMVYNFNETVGIQFGFSFPLFFPNMVRVPLKTFVGLRF